MTTPDYAAIQARLDAATDGPWEADDRTSALPRVYSTDPDVDTPPMIAEVHNVHDAHLVAHAPTDLRALLGDVERLERWKAEASEVMLGLQDLGRALGLPLGTRITGPAAIQRAQALADENQRLRDTIQAVERLLAKGERLHADQVALDHLRAALGVSGE